MQTVHVAATHKAKIYVKARMFGVLNAKTHIASASAVAIPMKNTFVALTLPML